jgi:hypothetical protein
LRQNKINRQKKKPKGSKIRVVTCLTCWNALIRQKIIMSDLPVAIPLAPAAAFSAESAGNSKRVHKRKAAAADVGVLENGDGDGGVVRQLRRKEAEFAEGKLSPNTKNTYIRKMKQMHAWIKKGHNVDPIRPIPPDHWIYYISFLLSLAEDEEKKYCAGHVQGYKSALGWWNIDENGSQVPIPGDVESRFQDLNQAYRRVVAQRKQDGKMKLHDGNIYVYFSYVCVIF